MEPTRFIIELAELVGLAATLVFAKAMLIRHYIEIYKKTASKSESKGN